MPHTQTRGNGRQTQSARVTGAELPGYIQHLDELDEELAEELTAEELAEIAGDMGYSQNRIEASRRRAEVYGCKGIALCRSGLYQEAVRNLKVAAGVHPDRIKYLEWLMEAHIELFAQANGPQVLSDPVVPSRTEDLRAAKELAQRILSADPRNRRALEALVSIERITEAFLEQPPDTYPIGPGYVERNEAFVRRVESAAELLPERPEVQQKLREVQQIRHGLTLITVGEVVGALLAVVVAFFLCKWVVIPLAIILFKCIVAIGSVLFAILKAIGAVFGFLFSVFLWFIPGAFILPIGGRLVGDTPRHSPGAPDDLDIAELSDLSQVEGGASEPEPITGSCRCQTTATDLVTADECTSSSQE